MSEYVVPLAKVMLLRHLLQNGGSSSCPVHRPEVTLTADITIELDGESIIARATFGPLTGSLKLQRDDSANYLHLRDFIQDIANGRTETGRQSELAIALMEAFDSVDQVINDDQIAYVTPTTSTSFPFGAVVTNGQGEVCAAAIGSSKEHLAELIRIKLLGIQKGIRESA
ncbi:hypothetical protein G3435_07050 [Pseudomonas sp. MAFF212428]|uniref:Uncharacterized protein n=1 Tax=Pseudomonas brassicae TaxID=2708063 RepID=A0A6B3P0Z3_9PSED|nr:hypothetical protein [Pseudomonas brassicae]NER59807.1 hypothetical protein [Pseudomonas brassicae]NER65424.1 hypothetical protein [Pseudomonas brassicae]